MKKNNCFNALSRAIPISTQILLMEEKKMNVSMPYLGLFPFLRSENDDDGSFYCFNALSRAIPIST